MCDNICIYLRYDVIENYATAMKVETYPNKKGTGLKSKIEIKMERQKLQATTKSVRQWTMLFKIHCWNSASIYAQLTSSYPGALSANAKIEGRIFFRRMPKVTDSTIVTAERRSLKGFLAKKKDWNLFLESDFAVSRIGERYITYISCFYMEWITYTQAENSNHELIE